MQLNDAATILSRADFFSVCDAEQRRLLAFASERKKFRPATVIYAAGEVPEGAHVLISGTVSTFTEGGENNPFIIHKSGAVLGVASLVLSRARPVTLKAMDAVETLLVPRASFLKLARENPELAAKAAERVRADLEGYLSALTQVRGRIAP